MTIAPPPTIPAGMSPVGNATFEGYYKDLTSKPWCVVEHSVYEPTTQQQTVIFITACKLHDVYGFAYARANTEWLRTVNDTTYLYVRIVLIGERMDCMREATRQIRTAKPMPICNMKGYDARGLARPVCCSNGNEYATQKAASEALGIAQSQISNHMSGNAAHARGLTFWYKE